MRPSKRPGKRVGFPNGGQPESGNFLAGRRVGGPKRDGSGQGRGLNRGKNPNCPRRDKEV